DDRLASARADDPLEHHVRTVGRVALDVALSGESVHSPDHHREVDVRRTAGILHGPYGAKEVLASRSGEESSKPLEVGILRSLCIGVRALTVEIGPVVIDLPYLDDCV